MTVGAVTDAVHATAVRVGTAGVLIRGASGSGKSTLALALFAAAADAVLVADDRVELTRADDRLRAAPPAAIAGLIEIRGFGIVRRDFCASAAIELVVDIVPPAEAPRLPTPEERVVRLLGCGLPRLFLPTGSAAEGAARVLAALDAIRGKALIHSGGADAAASCAADSAGPDKAAAGKPAECVARETPRIVER